MKANELSWKFGTFAFLFFFSKTILLLCSFWNFDLISLLLVFLLPILLPKPSSLFRWTSYKKCELVLLLFKCFDSEIWSTLLNKLKTKQNDGHRFKNWVLIRTLDLRKSGPPKIWLSLKNETWRSTNVLPFFSSHMKSNIREIYFHIKSKVVVCKASFLCK